ncbi:MAG: TlpA family protein disulfide reductase, partial [bacterium]|nr:TlpA family protein disulfide reductase [bacterium]
MKRSFILMLVVTLMCTCLFAGEKKSDEAAVKEFFKDSMKLYKESKFDELLKLVDAGMIKFPDQKNELMGNKFQLLMTIKRYKEALTVGLEADKLTGEKSNRQAMGLASAYLKTEDKENAVKWLTIAADRGARDFEALENGGDYDVLKSDKRIAAVIKKMKDNLGFGKPVKAFQLKDLGGNDISPAKYKGKVLLLDFWATWCGPCVKEIPTLVADYAELKGKGFEIIGISLDKDKAKLDAFIKDNKVSWPIAFSGGGWKDATARLYGINSIPSTWLVDKKGNLRYFGIRGEKLKEAVKKLLA